MADSVENFEPILRRAYRNIGLCVVKLQECVPHLVFGDAMAHGWREKADRLMSAVRRAERFAKLGDFDKACEILCRENDPV
jgi:hypothetical protein